MSDTIQKNQNISTSYLMRRHSESQNSSLKISSLFNSDHPVSF